ncbi:MAG: hypothetical protein JWP89_1311 [Schlesneria sp.]|nr:hypothetical protein [Schlesneria sp.]
MSNPTTSSTASFGGNVPLTPNVLSRILVHKTRQELESSACGFKVTLPLVAEHLGISLSMVKKIIAGKKEFGRDTFRGFANRSGMTFEGYVAALVKWDAIYGDNDHVVKNNDQLVVDSPRLTDDLGDAFSRLDVAFAKLRHAIRTRSWGNRFLPPRDCPVQDSRHTFTLTFTALAKFCDLISVRLLRSAAVIFHRDTQGDLFGYGLRRDSESGEWKTPYLSRDDISTGLIQWFTTTWGNESERLCWLQASDLRLPSPETPGVAGTFFATTKTQHDSDRILICPVHEQYHPVTGVRVPPDSTRTTLILRFSADYSAVVTQLAEMLADRLVDMIEYIRLTWIQDLAAVRSLTDSALSLSMRTLPSQPTQLEEECCDSRVGSLTEIIRRAMPDVSAASQSNSIGGGTANIRKQSLRKMLKRLLAFDFWVFDEVKCEFRSHSSNTYRVCMPYSDSISVTDPGQERLVSYSEAYKNYLSELRPSGVGGKSIACIAWQCFLNVDRSLDVGLFKRAVRLLERGNQVAVPFDVMEYDKGGRYTRISHAIGWFRFEGHHDIPAVKAFVEWLDSLVRKCAGVKIRIGGPSTSVATKGRKLNSAEIQKALDVGASLLKSPQDFELLQDAT